MSFDLDDHNEEQRPHHAPQANGYATHRELPNSIEAEEYLISSCLLDSGDVVPRCIDARIRPDSFYEPKHGIIYDIILDLHARDKPIGIDVVAEELKASRRLDRIGGYAFLTQVSSRVPTTAQASYFIDKVREQSLLRGIIRSATGAVEDCYNFSGGIEDFSSKVRQRIEDVTAGATGAVGLLTERKFDPKAKIVDSRVAYAIGDVPICTAGNLTSIVAQSGVGKSAVVGALIAAAMSTPTDGVDCLGFSGPNYDKRPLLHFDTEQSKADYQKLLHRSLRRSGRNDFPSWLNSFHLTGLSAPECRHMVDMAIGAYARKYGGLFAVIIDGWADMVMDPNAGDECFPFVAGMHATAIKYDMPIIGVLHLNPGSEAKSRGHLGSQLERKAETVLRLEMGEEDITAMYSTKRRGAPIRRDDGPRFSWNNDASMHTLVHNWHEQAAAKRAAKKTKKSEDHPGQFTEKHSREEQISFYPASNAKPEMRGIVFRRAQELSKISDSTLDRMRIKFLVDGWLTEHDGRYRRTPTGDDWAKRKPGAAPAKPQIEEQIEM